MIELGIFKRMAGSIKNDFKRAAKVEEGSLVDYVGKGYEQVKQNRNENNNNRKQDVKKTNVTEK